MELEPIVSICVAGKDDTEDDRSKSVQSDHDQMPPQKGFGIDFPQVETLQL